MNTGAAHRLSLSRLLYALYVDGWGHLILSVVKMKYNVFAKRTPLLKNVETRFWNILRYWYDTTCSLVITNSVLWPGVPCLPDILCGSAHAFALLLILMIVHDVLLATPDADADAAAAYPDSCVVCAQSLARVRVMRARHIHYEEAAARQRCMSVFVHDDNSMEQHKLTASYKNRFIHLVAQDQRNPSKGKMT